jgi:hypothetical protein
MATVELSDDTLKRINEFKTVIEAVINDKIPTAACLELVLQQGIDSMLTNLYGSQEPAVLIESSQQLAIKYPAEVFHYIADTIDAGEMEIESQNLKNRMGFQVAPKKT